MPLTKKSHEITQDLAVMMEINNIFNDINVTGSRFEITSGKSTWVRTIYYLQIIWWENRKFQQRPWSGTILHREDMVQAGCD